MNDEVKKFIKQLKTWNWIMFCVVLVALSVSIGHNIVEDAREAKAYSEKIAEIGRRVEIEKQLREEKEALMDKVLSDISK